MQRRALIIFGLRGNSRTIGSETGVFRAARPAFLARLSNRADLAKRLCREVALLAHADKKLEVVHVDVLSAARLPVPGEAHNANVKGASDRL